MFNLLAKLLLAPATDEGLAAAISEAVDTATPEDVKSGSQETSGDAAADEGATGGETEGAGTGAADQSKDGGGVGRSGEGDGTDAGAGDDDAARARAGAGADAGEGDAGKGKKPSEGAAADEGAGAGERARDKDGRFVKTKPGDPPAGTPGKDAAGKPKAPDHVNDPIPDEIKGRTKERLEGLITIAKNAQTELTAAKSQNDELMKAIGETGTNPEQFGNVMDVLTQLNAGDDKTRRAGITALRKMADDLAIELGETPPGKDPLEGHADLLQDLEDGEITRERAVEIAAHRNRQKAGEHRETVQTDEQRQAASVSTAKTALNTLEQQLVGTDKLYAAKRKIIEPAFAIAVQTLPPAQWAAAYKRMYDAVKMEAPRPTTTVERAPGGTGQRQPARPGKPAQGGGPSAPKSLAEAIDFGIEQARNAR